VTIQREQPRIGGEFELSMADLLAAPSPRTAPSLGRAHEVWVDTGRSALLLAAREVLGRGGERRVWLPALRIDRAAFRARDVWVIEDCVQAGLSIGVGASGDFAVASYRKLVPQSLADADECFISQRLVGKLLRGQDARAADFLPLFEVSESSLERAIVPRRQSRLSGYLLARTDFDAAARRRRANWQMLLERLTSPGAARLISAIFGTLQPGEVPLGLPVRVRDGHRNELRSFLREQQVYCPVHWPLRSSRRAVHHRARARRFHTYTPDRPTNERQSYRTACRRDYPIL
jgi:hypothetical protein